jgi:hypothetical protein
VGINFDQLAQETIALSEVNIAVSQANEGPGVIFYLDQGISTYCLRGLASEDLEWEEDLLQRKDPNFLRTFRLKEGWQEDQFIFYPTESFIDAEIIVEQMMGKRFPKEEAVLCNLSDPGFSWWLDYDEARGRLEIFYQSQRIERDHDLIQLGPLGDSMLASKRFSFCLPFLKSLFAVNEFSSSDQSFVLSAARADDKTFSQYKYIFLRGDFELEQDFSGLSGDERTYYLFIRELALLRRFWLHVQNELLT